MDYNMSASNYENLVRHYGHKIECVMYGNSDNVAIECQTCSEILLDFDKKPSIESCNHNFNLKNRECDHCDIDYEQWLAGK